MKQSRLYCGIRQAVELAALEVIYDKPAKLRSSGV